MIVTILAMDPPDLVAFAGAGVLLNLTPGPDVVFTMARGAQGIARAYGALAGAFGTVLRAMARLLKRRSASVFGGLAARLVLD